MAAQERELTPERSVRDLFGFQLRDLRKRNGLSLAELSKLVAYSKTHLGNVETAIRAIPPDLPRKLDELLTTDGIFNRLYPLVLREAFPDRSRRFMELEALAASMRKYAAGAFPGLWQTPDYGHAAIRLGRPRAEQDEIEQVWAARAARQRRLTDESPPLVRVVLDESVIRRPVGSPAVMRRQLDHVLTLAEGPHNIVQVLPFSAGGHGAMGGSITLLDFLDAPRVAYAEGSVSGHLLESPDAVLESALTYDLVQAAALSPDESTAWLRRAREDFRR
ncbi:helix-turn-helix transcriptional regulator [Kitasatospora sp. NPDC088346]|uniref:helix-turn-helix domain-containing protein n=1 Tax=Kitasatospora sp. NPDC088346 TaxID=3364073 RepID=UPI00382AEF0B